jgi:uncharacterized damage-inducible protein DinB
MIERTRPAKDLREREMLVDWLEYHRATLALKCDGLADDGLRARSVPPSTMSLLGLVRHMADVERYWFRIVLDGEEVAPRFWGNPRPDEDFDGVETAVVAEDFAAWHEECAIARERTAAHGLDDAGEKNGNPVTLRWILAHMIEEYARHNGHADLLREAVDGVTGQ